LLALAVRDPPYRTLPNLPAFVEPRPPVVRWQLVDRRLTGT